MAIDNFKSAYDISQNIDYLIKIANVFSSVNDKKEAEKFYNKAKKIDSLNTYFYFSRSKHWIRNGKSELAEKDLLKSIEIDSEDPEGYYYLAKLYMNNNRLFFSNRYFTYAIERLKKGGYIINKEDGLEELSITDLYVERAEIYKLADEKEIMCHDYKIACDLGDCVRCMIKIANKFGKCLRSI